MQIFRKRGPKYGRASRLSAFRAGGAIYEPMHSEPEGKVDWDPCTFWSLALLMTLSRGKMTDASNPIWTQSSVMTIT